MRNNRNFLTAHPILCKSNPRGEPPGERPNRYAESSGYSLPDANLMAQASIRYYQFQDKDTPERNRDKLILPEYVAYQEARDPVLEWITAAPRPL